MEVTINYLPPFAEITNKKSEFFVSDEELTVAELLIRLAKRYDQRFQSYLYINKKSGALKALIKKNDAFAAKDELLKDGDQITIMIPIIGG